MSINNERFDVLHNFISPVTGRVLADFNYVLVGNAQGIATPSPILIDIRLEIIKLKQRLNKLVEADFIIGHPNNEIPEAQVLVTMGDGFMYNTNGTVSTTMIIPIGSLPDLPFTNIWIGDITNRPVPQQRIELLNLPTFLTVNPLNNFGLYNLYTGQFSVTSPTQIATPTTTQRIDMSNTPIISRGKMLIGATNYLPPIVTFDAIPPFVHVTGSLNWNPPALLGGKDAVLTEIGLNPGEIFIGNPNPGFAGEITTTTALLPTNLPDLTFRMIWRGNAFNRPVEVNDLTLLETRVGSLETTVLSIQGQIAQLEIQIGALQLQVGALDTALGLLTIEVQTIATTVAGLVTSVFILGTTVASLGLAVTTLQAQVTQLFNRPLNQINPPTGDVNMNNHKIINLANPVNPLDAVNLQTLTSAIAGTITAVNGTTNQIDATTLATVVTLSLPNDVIVNTSLTAGNLKLIGNILQSTNTNGNIEIIPDGSGDIILSPSPSTGFVGVGNTPSFLFDVFGEIRTQRLLGNTNSPPTVALGAAGVVGTGPTSSIVGSEVGGIFTLTTGTGLMLLGGLAATFTLASAMPSSTFSVVFYPANTNARGIASHATSTSSTVFTFTVGMGFVASTAYIWNYQIVGY